MENKVRIGVMLTHYVYGSDNQYTSDLTPLELDPRILSDKTLLEIALKDYCKEFASLMIPYDTNSEEYVLSFWLNDDRKITATLLSDYADCLGRGLDDVEILLFKKAD